MTDRELLELAAKAAGYKLEELSYGGCLMLFIPGFLDPWNPLTNDGDALRLAVKLRLVVFIWEEDNSVSVAKTLPDGDCPPDGSDEWILEQNNDDSAAAARRAIVRAAAKIGNSMQ